jgi:hypothetical protein
MTYVPARADHLDHGHLDPWRVIADVGYLLIVAGLILAAPSGA